MSLLDDVALTLCCHFCGAQPGHWCVTVRVTTRPPGLRATWLHNARMWPLHQAWQIGYHVGQQSAAEQIVWNLEARRQGHYWTRDRGIPGLPDDRVERWIRTLFPEERL